MDSAITSAGAELLATQTQQRQRDALVLLLAVLLTLVAILGFDAIPEERFEVQSTPQSPALLTFTPLPGVKATGEWLDDTHRRLRCHYPKGTDDPSYNCSINYFFGSGPGHGIDLSKYTRVDVQVVYKGDVPKLRLFARNFDARYSKTEDSNSTKYNAVFLPTKDLKHPVSLKLQEFTVAEWWQLMYKIPRELGQPDLSNVVSVGIDFSYPMTAGDHDLEVQHIAFVRPLLTRETWYLGILCAWLIGIFIYALAQLRLYRAQSSKLRREANRYRTLATTDPLTHALNRHGFEQRWERQQADAFAQPDQALALLMVDVDHFKRINDSRGHDTGDRVLRQLVALMHKQLRSTDWLARWGGEEFAILLPSVRPGHAPVLAETIRKAIASAAFEPDLVVTVSIGVALRRAGEDVDSLFKRADEALSKAQEAGRNQVVSADQDTVG